jgi:YYY domain-containing protein
MNSEFLSLFIWYLIIQILAWSTFPISYCLFPGFPDRGYALAKIQGLLFSAYISWLLTSLHLLPYQTTTAWLSVVFILVLGVGFGLIQSHRKDLIKFLQRNLNLLLLLEVIFLSAYLVFAFIRSYNPDITGAEKEPDFTFLNAILQSKTLPPLDTWFAGESLNYYYFGYFIWAQVIKLSKIPSSIGFNLAIATIPALSLVGAFSLGFKLTGRFRYGFLTGFLLCLAGNLDALIQWLERGRLFPFDWWRSSRIIPDTINEFPFFSFLLGDLHAHFMSIPFALLFLSLLYEVAWREKEKGRKGEKKNREVEKPFPSSFLSFFHPRVLLPSLFPLLPFCLSLGAAPFLNTWDFPTYLLLTFFCLFLGNLRKAETSNPHFQKSRLSAYVGRTFFTFLVLLTGSYILYLPFHLSFKSQVPLSSLRMVSSSQRTGVAYYLIIYGFFLFILITFAFCKFRYILSSFTQDVQRTLWGGLLLSFPILYLVFNTWVIPLTLPLTLLFLVLTLQERETASQFIYGLIFVATAILIGCELIYIKDFYAHPLERQNTIFKFYYQIWIFLSIGIPYLLYEIDTQGFLKEKVRIYWDYVFMFLLVALIIYPIAATYEKCNQFKDSKHGGLPYIPTLDGTLYIQFRYPQEYRAIKWLKENLSGQPVILEATGKPYSFYGRVSTNTGFPTVLGWGNHEALWRDQTWKSIMERTQDIQTIYTAPDKSTLQDLLKKYRIQYIYVGSLERQTYGPVGLEGFNTAFEPVYHQGEVIIYKVPKIFP